MQTQQTCCCRATAQLQERKSAKPHKPTNRYPNALCTQHRYMWCMFQNPNQQYNLYYTSQATTTMTSSSSSMTMAMCLLALCLAFTCVGSAAAAMSIPAVCLRAATTLCHGSETSALRCLVTKVRSGDASVPEECSNALKQQLPTLQQQQQQKGGSRKQSLMRLLTEVPTFACHKRPTVACQTACPAGSAGGPQQCTSGCKCTSYVDCVCTMHLLRVEVGVPHRVRLLTCSSPPLLQCYMHRTAIRPQLTCTLCWLPCCPLSSKRRWCPAFGICCACCSANEPICA